MYRSVAYFTGVGFKPHIYNKKQLITKQTGGMKLKLKNFMRNNIYFDQFVDWRLFQ